MSQSQNLSDSEEIRRLVDEQVKIEHTKYSSQQACQDELDAHGDCPFCSREVTDALHRNEDGDAGLYVEIHRDRFCYDTADRCWFKWSGHYWKEDILNDALRSINKVIDVYGCELDRLSIEQRKEMTRE